MARCKTDRQCRLALPGQISRPQQARQLSQVEETCSTLRVQVDFGPALTHNERRAVRLVRASAARLHRHRMRSFEFHQSINSNPLIINIATAVPPCTPKATILLPPWCNTITASAIGMRVAISMNQPRACADP